MSKIPGTSKVVGGNVVSTGLGEVLGAGQGMAEGKVGAADEGKVGAAGGDGKCGETDEGLDAEDNSCVVCMDAARTAVCVPCGHNAGCIECLTAIHESNQGCPVCRAELTQVIRLFTV